MAAGTGGTAKAGLEHLSMGATFSLLPSAESEINKNDISYSQQPKYLNNYYTQTH